MKVKVCGMRTPENIEALSALPIDMIGFIFYPKSKRFVGKQKVLQKWLAESGDCLGEIQRVGVFVNAELDEILNAVHDYALDYVQLHGDESPEYCRELQRFWDYSSVRKAKLIKAFAIDEDFDFRETQAYAPHCALFIFDTKGPEYGGHGVAFNWSLLEQYDGAIPFLLSGGIGPDMAPEIRRLNFPQMVGVDINSRFESSPGVKEIDQIRRFVSELNDVL